MLVVDPMIVLVERSVDFRLLSTNITDPNIKVVWEMLAFNVILH